MDTYLGIEDKAGNRSFADFRLNIDSVQNAPVLW